MLFSSGKFKILADQNTDLLIFILEKIATAPARWGKILAEPDMQNTDGANFKKFTKIQKCSRNGSPWLENQHKIYQNDYFFEPVVMAAAVLVKTIVFDKFLIFFCFFVFLGGG